MEEWMPVFLFRDVMRSHHAAHPDHKGAIPKESDAPGDEALLRIGTAVRQPDGSYIVELAALPVNGRLLMRAPKPTDLLAYARKGGK